MGFGNFEVIWHNEAKSGPNMGVAARRHRWAVGVPESLKSLFMGPSLLDNCYLENKISQHFRVTLSPLNPRV